MTASDPSPLLNEHGIFDIDDDAVLTAIAGGLSAAPSVLDNHCVTNDSKCGKTAPSPSGS